MSKLEANVEILDYYSDDKRKDILARILEQVELLGEDNLDSLGSSVLGILKKNLLVFKDGVLVTE